MENLALDLDPAGEWLVQAARRPSPNCDERPAGCAIDLVVIHGISLPPGCYGDPYIGDFFTNCLDFGAHPYFATIRHLKVSCHLLIDRAGSLTQFVPFTRRAWHAGESRFQGRAACNDFSIGIELEGTDTEPYQAAQYRAAAAVLQALMGRWPAITRQRITGHADIAPGRKTDPGPAFDWRRLHALLGETGDN